ncbi:MAG: hypothetical protein B7Z53_05055 [Rhodospirillales bacterium 12-71-4]|nr:MAG: hypothetical protein B7Z53_05055 [Rhodospirillales bacterium 12-71-4]
MSFYDRKPSQYEAIAGIYRRFLFPGSRYVIKDVVQPFHTLRFLRENRGLCHVLYIRRDLHSVAHSLRKRSWGYVHSMEALDQQFMMHGFVECARIMFDPAYLFSRLRALGYALTEFDYLSEEFRRIRDGVLDSFEATGFPQASEPHGPPPGPFPLGRQLDLNSQDHGRPNCAYLGEGWNKPEWRGVWAGRAEAGLAFEVPSLAQPSRLRLLLGPNALRNFAVEVEMRFLEQTTKVATVSAEAAEKHVDLRLPATRQPAMLRLALRSERLFVPAILSETPSLSPKGVCLAGLSIEDA